MHAPPRSFAPSPLLRVEQGLDAYLRSNGFTTAGYDALTAEISLGPLTVTVPNPPARRRAIAQHDVHHVLTGYGTDLVGEAEVGAWELGAGCTTPFLYFINLTAAVIGALLAPRRVARAWLRGRGQSTLYRAGLGADEVRGLSIGELRARLGVPAAGLADRPPARHAKAPRASLGAEPGSRPA
jgi:hypothetical protein